MSTGDVQVGDPGRGRARSNSTKPLEVRTLFAQCLRYGEFHRPTGRFRKLVLRALVEAGRCRASCPVLHQPHRARRRDRRMLARANKAWPARLAAAELFGIRARRAGARRTAALPAAMRSRSPTSVSNGCRKHSLRHVDALAETGAKPVTTVLLDFYCAVARQCFVNQYVYRADRRRSAIGAALARVTRPGAGVGGCQCPALWPVAVGAYFPLHTLADARRC